MLVESSTCGALHDAVQTFAREWRLAGSAAVLVVSLSVEELLDLE